MPKSPYRAPRLVDYGSLASLTLGSGGTKDDAKVSKTMK
jgi:hypothetical protein